MSKYRSSKPRIIKTLKRMDNHAKDSIFLANELIDLPAVQGDLLRKFHSIRDLLAASIKYMEQPHE